VPHRIRPWYILYLRCFNVLRIRLCNAATYVLRPASVGTTYIGTKEPTYERLRSVAVPYTFNTDDVFVFVVVPTQQVKLDRSISSIMDNTKNTCRRAWLACWTTCNVGWDLDQRTGQCTWVCSPIRWQSAAAREENNETERQIYCSPGQRLQIQNLKYIC
jgi:hypothetical protein